MDNDDDDSWILSLSLYLSLYIMWQSQQWNKPISQAFAGNDKSSHF